jgi:hypothetical protein
MICCRSGCSTRGEAKQAGRQSHAAIEAEERIDRAGSLAIAAQQDVEGKKVPA